MGEEPERFAKALCEQDPIEWIAMMGGEFGKVNRVPACDRQGMKTAGFYGAFDVVRIDSDASQSGFNGELPDGCRTDQYVIIHIFNESFGLPRQSPVVGQPPYKNRRVEQELHSIPPFFI